MLIAMIQVQEMINKLQALQEDITNQYQGYQQALRHYMEYQWWLNLQALGRQERVLHQAHLQQV